MNELTGWYESVFVVVWNYIHNELRSRAWRGLKCLEVILLLPLEQVDWHEEALCVFTKKRIKTLIKYINFWKRTSFKPQFHYFVKLGSQVPNSYLSVAVNQMVSGRCLKDSWGSVETFLGMVSKAKAKASYIDSKLQEELERLEREYHYKMDFEPSKLSFRKIIFIRA